MDYKEPELKGIGFILFHEKSSSSLKSYAVSIDEVEKRTGIDFYHSLPDSLEEKIESAVDVEKWSFRSSRSYGSSSTYLTKQEKLTGEQKININNASKSELMRFPGIGDNLSGKIIKYRNIHGQFNSLDNLQSVKGIGPKTVAKLKPYATVN